MNDRAAAPDPAAELDALVGEWLTLPDLAEALGTDVGKARRLVQERRVVGVRRGERTTFQVPARFLVPLHLVDPANVGTPTGDDRRGVLASLQGTIVVLTDAGFSDAEILAWLFAPQDELGEAPLDALLAGRKAHVRRVAQSLG
ncbi:Rv2175c family DNA-binding protein [Cellulosimicrobium marinum]|uniref:Rv2175c family DNA-binding protein n=1 Tax=Cellulosimicrobium marinum TaxID=1638992 RepID=UPI001E382A8E|nr:Rv2175c family DNA-binding protein [Cellulosimicrobium marinum]MCB7137260.1 DNA-binding protein [Cellulosimicrobium marinum]